jgi:hypothetical protein
MAVTFKDLNSRFTAAVRELENELVEHGVDPRAAREIAEAEAPDRVAVDGGGRVYTRSVKGNAFDPFVEQRPLRRLAGEIVPGLPAAMKPGVPHEPTPEEIAAKLATHCGWL